MPSLQTNLEYNDKSIIIWRKGTAEDPYKPRADSLPIINGLITLLEIPSETHKVQISGFTEVAHELYRKKVSLEENEFLVDYANGSIQFHPMHEGVTLVSNYLGKGKILYPASRIYAMVQRNPDIVITLQDYIDSLSTLSLELNLKLVEINNAISDAVQAATSANIAADNAAEAAFSAEQAAQTALDAAASTVVIRQDSVDEFDDLLTTYPSPENGWQVTLNTTGDVYRYDGVVSHQWINIGNLLGGTIPYVSENSDGLLHKEDYRNFVLRTVVFQFPRILSQGVQNALIKIPFDGIITKAYSSCSESGLSAPIELSIEKVAGAEFSNNGVWDNLLAQNLIIPAGMKESNLPVIGDIEVNQGDYFRINVLQLDNNIRGVTVQIDINTKYTATN
ncbi:hypothetical protein K0T92_04940 [Paenibacillus oenotherae]|uniref:BppU N-terminal domain-containing protein n=1 Tax=Paenibacillus oenotherae TaxID=1435645 RepID=A0ABS7D2B2_9BACL|nr:hypothetical protein [Paenibacillus oenotherae]MBW7474079.1 hypothetical protein [Paenibacillus oenotherae]